MGKYKEKEFKSLSESGDLGLGNAQRTMKTRIKIQRHFPKSQRNTKDKVKDVRASKS